MTLRKASCSLLALSLASVVSTPVMAQEAADGSEDIIVTARKRDETLISVPVSVTAIGGQQLQNFAINSIDAMARAVPSLIVGEGGGTVQGGIIAIRGIAGADNNPLNDQAVSFNVDGVSIGRATVRRMGDFDTAQVEVLKGPQALFFGKNSPGGIISLRTNDPTEHLEAKLASGYEFEADEWRTDAYVSGPLGSGFGFRIAGFYSDQKGWSKNAVPRDFTNIPGVAEIFPVPHKHAPDKTDWAIRGTLKYDDGGPFNAKLKVSYGEVNGQSSSANTQFVNCPLGRPQNSVGIPAGLYIDDCKADDVNQVGEPNLENVANLFTSEDFWSKGLKMEQYQFLAGLEMNYDLTDDLTLTSQTGYYKQNLDNIGNFTQSYYEDGAVYFLDGSGNPAAPGTGAQVRRWHLPSLNELGLREFSQELRLTSNFDGVLNIMLGGLITDTHGENGSTTAARTNTVPPVPINRYWYVQKGKSQSVFGQVIANPIEVIEFTAGARWSWEQKKLPTLMNMDFTVPEQMSDVGARVPRRKRSFHDVSPEFTLAYKPNPDLNIYGSYKEGFLSGGFASLTPPPGTAEFDASYDQQTTRGIEGGIKAALLDRALRLNLVAYNYKTKGLQVGVTIAGVQQVLRNAGSVRTKGVDFDFSYRTPLEGLSVNGAVSYNKAYYLSYFTSCYRGQPSETCFIQTSPITGTGLLQNLSGQPLVRAPRWTGNAGFNYSTPLGGSMKLGLSGNMTYSDDYFTDTTNTPGGQQPSYTLFDASLRLGADDDSWELALIGRNLTNEWYFVRSSDSPFTGSNPGAYTASDPLRLLGDTAAYVSRGRELWVRLSYKFGAK